MVLPGALTVAALQLPPNATVLPAITGAARSSIQGLRLSARSTYGGPQIQAASACPASSIRCRSCQGTSGTSSTGTRSYPLRFRATPSTTESALSATRQVILRMSIVDHLP